MREHLSILVAVALAGVAGQACGDNASPVTASTAEEQAQVVAAIQDSLGDMMTDSGFGEEGAVFTGAPPSAIASFSPSDIDSVSVPRFWGRLRIVRGGPKPVIEKNITIVGDTARASLTVHFQGIFLVDTSADGVFNPTSKPLQEYFTQQAVFVRDGTTRHHWHPVLLSPEDWKPTAPDRQTVHVTDVQIFRNDTLLLDVKNPDSLYDFHKRVPRFHMGDTVKVVAAVANTTGGSLLPPTFVFLHVRHADRSHFGWVRVLMHDNGDGTYTQSWVAHRTGRDRFAVDAIDAATLALGRADNYRASIVGIPFHIE
jgi:hypothetical protein